MTETSSVLHRGAFEASATGSRVDYVLLAPAGVLGNGPVPLVLHLHGAMSSAVASLERARGSYERAWRSGELPPAVVACVSTPTQGGFYMDYAGGPRWESLVAEEFPGRIAESVQLDGRHALIGFSMGGYGALKMAFRSPERYAAVAALCPAVFPAEEPQLVPPRNVPGVLADLHRAMDGPDGAYGRNSVHSLLKANAAVLRKGGLAIYFDCGEADEFRLHDGAEFLHRQLSGLGVAHAFVSVPGAAHFDAAAVEREASAIRFIGRALRGP
jgi:S-formylglutathione hydrolase